MEIYSMDKSSKELVLEARTIVHLLHCIVKGCINCNEEIPRGETAHLIDLAKMRLDEFNNMDQSLH